MSGTRSVGLRFLCHVAFVLFFVATSIAERLQVCFAVLAAIYERDFMVASPVPILQSNTTNSAASIEFIIDAESNAGRDWSAIGLTDPLRNRACH